MNTKDRNKVKVKSITFRRWHNYKPLAVAAAVKGMCATTLQN
jgi:hypothetical protein